MEEDVLMHYGVKGMKWGVRKDKSKGNIEVIKYQYGIRRDNSPDSVREGRYRNGKNFGKKICCISDGRCFSCGFVACNG